MNYEIIRYERDLVNFIAWLPELQSHEIYYLSLFARKKYAPELKYSKTDKTQLKRFTSNKDRMIGKIRQLECEVGSYYLKGTIAPQESIALYITVNPRSQVLASRKLLIKLAELVGEPYNGHNLHQIALSNIQASKSRSCWVDFDLDIHKTEEFALYIHKTLLSLTLNPDAYKILETHGGYHILVDPLQVAKANRKTWYNSIKKAFVCDVVGDNMIPVVGCNQGMFSPKFLEFKG